MLDKSFLVKYVTSRNCFCYLSDKNNHLLEKGNVLEIQYGSENIFVTCLPLSGLKVNEIGINVTFARSLGIREHDTVSVSTSPDLPGVKSIVISPVTKDDYEIIELLADNIQNTMLNQVRVVNKNKRLIIWISNIHVVVNIDDTSPVPRGRLNYLTEVQVNPPNVQKTSDGKNPDKTTGKLTADNQKPNAKPSMWSLSFTSFFNKPEEQDPSTQDVNNQDVMETSRNTSLPLIFRMHSIEDLKSCIKIESTPKIFRQPFNVFVKKQYLPDSFKICNGRFKNNKGVDGFKHTNGVDSFKKDVDSSKKGVVSSKKGVDSSKKGVDSSKNDVHSSKKDVHSSNNIKGESLDEVDTFENIHLFLLKMIQPLVAVKDFLDERSSEREVVVRLCILEDFCDDVLIENICRLPSLFVNESIFKYFGVKIGAKVLLEAEELKETTVDSIEVNPWGNKKLMPSDVRNFILENCGGEQKFLLNANAPLNISDTPLNNSNTPLNNSNIPLNNSNTSSKINKDTNLYCSLKFSPIETKYVLVDEQLIKKCKVFIGESIPDDPHKEDKINDVQLSPEEFCLTCANYENIINDSMEIVKMGMNINNYEMENTLITGKPGTGKSALTQLFTENINKTPYHIHTEVISCKNIKGKTIESLNKIFTNTFAYLIYYQPSLLILDDLDVLCEKVVEGDAPTQESLHYNRVSEWLAGLFELHLQSNCIAVLATAQSVMRLNQNIFSSRGRHFFKNVYTIRDFNKTDRKTLLKHLFLQKIDDVDIDLDTLSLKTEGYVVQDLVDVVDKVIFEAYKKGADKVTMDHCETALEKTSSLSLRDVQLHSPGEKDFSDVGGLEDVKKILVESMLWPAQYSNLFGKAPLRLQSGLLLYGPPGTGKTILAGAAAKHCGLRLISIKGPELLSKYIGASEQAVRDVFQKAQSAKPCILFFDEFDSLAPRRGHDSTGVTDRVVNQFLTQLDGVETLTGVCVLAATSRPDLLDPALLRPGRLDKQILCPLPNKSARLAILKSLSKNMTLSKTVNLEKIAGVTENFSGADLQAVLYTAQLSSVEVLLDGKSLDGKVERKNVDGKVEGKSVERKSVDGKVEGKKKANTNRKPEISQAALMDALKNTRPSLTRDEKTKYDRIYAKFQGRADIQDIKAGKQRTTLA